MTTYPSAGPLVIRRHRDDGVESEACFSACGSYRYALTRTWDAERPGLAFVMLNPSTADERTDDATVARCVRRARDGGWGAVRVCNLFALRETRPARLRRHPQPEGAANAAALLHACRWASAVVAAWGVGGAHLEQGPRVADLLRGGARRLMHLGLTRGGQPRHPLYVPYRRQPIPWE
jgi:hypothetical protein